MVSLIAFFAWDSQYPGSGGTNIEFRYLQETGDALEPAQALARLDAGPAVQYHDTRLSESAFWLRFVVPVTAQDAATELELPSRHAVETTCWDASNLTALGHASRSAAGRPMKAVKAGFAIELGRPHSAVTVLCRGTFAGPARISVVRWSAPDLDMSIQKFNRESGLLDGGLIVLTLFVLLTAIINREWIYVLFAAWLVANLRLAALSAGWDTQWFARTIPLDWMLPMRKFAIAAYYVLTITLFGRLFRNELMRVGYPKFLQFAQWSCVPLLFVAVALPYSQFLPYAWLSAAFSIAVLVFYMTRILFITRSTVAMWYSASLGIALFASLYEVISAALGIKTFIGTVNSVTAALSSSLMAALAIAEQMRLERQEKVKAQAELRSTYEAIPIGLFTLDRDGAFIAGNPALREMLGADLFLDDRKYWSDLFEPGAWGRLQDLVSGRAGQEIEIRNAGKSGHDPEWFLVKATLSKDRIE
jgi:PAS domain-containing protein